MKTWFIGCLYFVASLPAFAEDAVRFDIELMMRVEMDLHQLCRLPESPDVVSDEACALRDTIRIELTKLGYKFNLTEREWVK